MPHYDDEPQITKVFLYTRKSDESKNNQVGSIRDQRKDCLELAEKFGLEIVEEFTEEETAHHPNRRTEFKRMLSELKITNPQKRRADGILAWHPDRLARNALEAGVVLQMVDDELIKDMFFPAYRFHNDSSGKEHLFMEFARAKGYSDKLSDIVIRGSISRENVGAMLYGTKFGYDKRREDPLHPAKCSLYPIPEKKEFPSIQAMFQLRLQGYTLDRIRAHLIENKLTNRKGNVISRQSISKHLQDPFYYGLRVVNAGKKDERTTDYRILTPPAGIEFVPVLKEEEFWQCQRINRGDEPKQVKSRREHPLRGGFIQTPEGHPLYPAEHSVGRAGGRIEKQLGYECQVKGANQPRIKADIIFEAIEREIQKIDLTQKEYDQFVIGQREFLENKRSERKQKRKRLTEVIDRAERDLEESEATKAKMISQDQFDADAKKWHKDKKSVLKEEFLNYKKEQQDIDGEFDKDMITFEAFLELSNNAHHYWAKANPQQKHRIAEIMLLNLIVKGKEVQSMTFKKPFDKWLKTQEGNSGGHART